MEKKTCRGEERDLSITYRRINVDLAKNNNLTTLLHKLIPRRACAPKGSSPDLLAVITLYHLELYQFECSTCSVSCKACRFTWSSYSLLFCYICSVRLISFLSIARREEKSHFSCKFLQFTYNHVHVLFLHPPPVLLPRLSFPLSPSLLAPSLFLSLPTLLSPASCALGRG